MEVKLTPEWERRLTNALQTLTITEKRVADYVTAHRDRVEGMSIVEIADVTQVSQATVVRFCHRIGYKGLKDFKIALALASKPHVSNTYLDDSVGDASDTASVLRDTIRRYIACLQDTAMIGNEQAFEAAVSAIIRAEKLDIYGVGGSVSSVNLARHMLMKVGIRANECTNYQSQQVSVATLEKNDVVLVVTNMGESHELLSVVPMAKARGAIVICVTCRQQSRIAQISDIVLVAAIGLLPDTLSAPRVGINVMLDALCHGIRRQVLKM